MSVAPQAGLHSSHKTAASAYLPMANMHYKYQRRQGRRPMQMLLVGCKCKQVCETHAGNDWQNVIWVTCGRHQGQLVGGISVHLCKDLDCRHAEHGRH